MVTHMKTTIDIADDLLDRAKHEARREKRTLRAIVEEALRAYFGRAAVKQKTVKPVVVKGTTSPEVFNNLHQLIIDSYETGEPSDVAKQTNR